MHVECNSAAVAKFIDWINGATTAEQLDCLSAELWQYNARGEVSDEEATRLSEAISSRRPSRAPAGAVRANISSTVKRVLGRIGSRYQPRQRPTSPDRVASKERRRRLGGSGALPDTLRHRYTEGQRSVLTVVAGEVKRHGICDLPIDRIAALAGVCRTTVQTTLHEARRLDHIDITERPQRGRKSLTNIVRIVSAAWRAWISRGPVAHRPIGSKVDVFLSPTKNKESKKQEKRAFEKARKRPEPPPRGDLWPIQRSATA